MSIQFKIDQGSGASRAEQFGQSWSQFPKCGDGAQVLGPWHRSLVQSFVQQKSSQTLIILQQANKMKTESITDIHAPTNSKLLNNKLMIAVIITHCTLYLPLFLLKPIHE